MACTKETPIIIKQTNPPFDHKFPEWIHAVLFAYSILAFPLHFSKWSTEIDSWWALEKASYRTDFFLAWVVRTSSAILLGNLSVGQ